MRPARPAFVVFIALLAALTSALGCRSERPGGPVGTDAPASPPSSSALPALAVSPQQVASISRILLDRPDDDEPTGRSVIVLERSGDGWRVTTPLRARATADKVAALLGNLQDLHVTTRLAAGAELYERFALTEGRALHVVARTPTNETVVEFLAGKSSEQGQLIRLPGIAGIFALANEGPHAYQGFLYTRDLRSWRDPGLLSFDERDVAEVEVANRHGVFRFQRPAGDPRWTAAVTPRRSDGKLAAPRPAWPRFDGHRVDEMLHAYHALAADDFGEPADRESAGLANPERSGGVVRIQVRQAAAPLILRVGAPALEGARFAVPGSRWAAAGALTNEGANDDPPCVLSPWTARWAVGDATTFERAR